MKLIIDAISKTIVIIGEVELSELNNFLQLHGFDDYKISGTDNSWYPWHMKNPLAPDPLSPFWEITSTNGKGLTISEGELKESNTPFDVLKNKRIYP